jgi:hypothetical protein
MKSMVRLFSKRYVLIRNDDCFFSIGTLEGRNVKDAIATLFNRTGGLVKVGA